jgi:hypothetical protein
VRRRERITFAIVILGDLHQLTKVMNEEEKGMISDSLRLSNTEKVQPQIPSRTDFVSKDYRLNPT